MAYVQFTLNSPCNNDPASIIKALNNPHNIIRIDFRNRSFINNPEIANNPANVTIQPGDQDRFIVTNLSSVLTDILCNERFITTDKLLTNTPYDRFVKTYFKDNALLMNKWLRYAETIRGL